METQYEFLKQIGEGSFGRVFRGRHKVTKEIVALKLIPKGGKSDKEIDTLRTEFEIQKNLYHPNIVRLIGTFETKSELISVTEYVPGELHKLFDKYKDNGRKRRLPEAKVREIAIDLMSALFYLHQNRILHRDIKPQNILIDDRGRAKLCDFGFARNLSTETHVLTSIKGTPLYMAPELIQEQPYDYAADIWSLGCILYELSVGEPPFPTKNIFDLIKKIRYAAVILPDDMSDVLRGFLQGLLEKNFKKRIKWPALLKHPFVADHFEKNPPANMNEIPDSLTEPLSESQELAKEIQRQDKAKLLPGGSQTLIKVAHKYEEQKKKLQAMLDKQKHEQLMMLQHQRQRRSSDVSIQAGIEGFDRSRRHSDMSFYQPQLQHQYYMQQPHPFSAEAWKTLSQAQYLIPQPPTLPQFTTKAPVSAAKPEAIKVPAETDTKALEEEEESIDDGDTSIENDEWCEFLDGQIEEALKDIEVLNNHNCIDMIVGPLKSPMTTALVTEKIVSVLILPFASKSKIPENIFKNLLDGYKSVKVLNRLIQALGHLKDSDSSTENPETLVQKDKALSLTATLVTRLIHSEGFSPEMIKIVSKMNDEKFSALFSWLLKKSASKMNCLTWLNKILDLGNATELSGRIELLLSEPLIVEILNDKDADLTKRLLILLCFLQKHKQPERLSVLKQDANLLSKLRKCQENLNLPNNIQSAVNILLLL